MIIALNHLMVAQNKFLRIETFSSDYLYMFLELYKVHKCLWTTLAGCFDEEGSYLQYGEITEEKEHFCEEFSESICVEGQGLQVYIPGKSRVYKIIEVLTI